MPHYSVDDIDHIHGRLVAARCIMTQLALRLVGYPAIKYRNRFEGLSYRDGFDCSGFVKSVAEYALRAVSLAIEVPRHANEQWRELGEWVAYDRRVPGDLVFFASRRKGPHLVVGHVGIVADHGETYIHSPGIDGSIIEKSPLPDTQLLLEKTTPHDIYAHDPVGIKRITVPFGSGRWHIL